MARTSHKFPHACSNAPEVDYTGCADYQSGVSCSSTAGTVGAGPLRPAVAATRLATVALSVSTRTGLITCITVPQAYKVCGYCASGLQGM